MADRLYLSCWIEGFNELNMLRHFEKMLELFPFSKLTKRGPVLRVYAVEHSEPPLIEREFSPGTEAKTIISAAREFMHGDCVAEVDASWDLWDYDGADWKLAPIPVTLACLGPDFDNENDDDLRVEFGVDSRFLPHPGVEGSARMGQSNLRSLMHFTEQVERGLKIERRQIWSESGANFADLLKQAVGTFYVN